MTTDTIQADENQIERDFNAAKYFIDRHLDEGRSDKIAFIDAKGEYSDGDLARRVNQAGNALKKAGVRQESRIAMIVQDTIDFPALFWARSKRVWCLSQLILCSPPNIIDTSSTIAGLKSCLLVNPSMPP